MSEGVIKFKIKQWNEINIPENIPWQKVDEYRTLLHKKKLIGFDETLKLGYGNISTRIKNTNQFIISGSQTGHLTKLDKNYYSLIKEVDFNNNSVVCEGITRPSSESITHAACYYADIKINSVIHIHNKKIWTHLIKSNSLSTPESAEYGSIKLTNAIINIVKNNTQEKPVIIVMKGHENGIICYGKNLKEVSYLLLELSDTIP